MEQCKGQEGVPGFMTYFEGLDVEQVIQLRLTAKKMMFKRISANRWTEVLEVYLLRAFISMQAIL